MRRLLVILLAGCATAPAVPERTDFARAYVARQSAPAPAEAKRAPRPRPEAPRTEKDETRGLVTVIPESRLGDLDAFLARAITADELAALAWRRSPDVKAARARVEAARTGYAQSDDLRDLLTLYRAFVRGTKTRVGPQAMPPPRVVPDVGTLSAELVHRTVEVEFERLRAVVRDTVAAAERAHADAARLAAAREVLQEDVALHESLVAVLRARFEAGDVTQAGLLAFEARLESLRTELLVLGDEESAVRARWNRLLSRPNDAPVSLAVAPAPRREPAADPVAVALEQRQELRAARLGVARADVAVRLAETMTLPRMDETAPMPRADFGVKEAQVQEMRERLLAAEAARDAMRDRTRSGVRQALFALESARRRWNVHENEIVPRARKSFESTRGAYEGARADYVELLDSARRLLTARLGQIDARRAHAHAAARLLEAVGVKEMKR